MRHYVGYHNVEGMGYELEDELDDEKFGFYSSKALSFLNKTKDQRIWIISGKKEGPKKTYRLYGCYTVKSIDKGDAGFDHIVSGKPERFPQPVVINDCEWFPLFFKEQGRFGLGINQTKNEAAIAGLKQVATQAQK